MKKVFFIANSYLAGTILGPHRSSTNFPIKIIAMNDNTSITFTLKGLKLTIKHYALSQYDTNCKFTCSDAIYYYYIIVNILDNK